MQLCPKCGKEIEKGQIVCPECGTEMGNYNTEEIGKSLDNEDNAEPEEKSKLDSEGNLSENISDTAHKIEDTKKAGMFSGKKKIIIPIICAVIVIAIVLSSISMKEKKYKETYKENLEFAAIEMLLGASQAEDCGNLIKSVWYNAIYKKRSSKTDKYVRNEYTLPEYNDFNTALSLLFKDQDFKSDIDSIKTINDGVKDTIRELQNPPEEYREAYNAVMDLYDSYIKLTNLVISPTGSLTSYSNDFNNADTEVSNKYNKAELYLGW